MTFHQPYIFFLLVPFLIVFFMALKKKCPSLLVANKNVFIQSKGKFLLNRTKLPLLLYFISCISLIIALARPQKGVEIIENKQYILDIILALDVSGSMEGIDAEDSMSRNEVINAINKNKLKTRIEVAKEELLNFVEKRKRDRLGLIVFAQTAFSSCPPTLDHDYLKEKIKLISTKILGDFNSSTGIAAPIKSAINKLKNSPSKRRIIILFTDGENNVKGDISPEQAAEIANEYNIIIYTVGVGSNNSYAIGNDIFGRRQLQKISSKFDKTLLEDIAAKTSGKYFHAKNQKSFQEVTEKIDKLERVEIKRKNFTYYKEFYHYFILFSLVFILIGFLLQSTFCRSLP